MTNARQPDDKMMTVNTNSTAKRFIAGATCMSCGHIDTTALYTENDVKIAECVDCHHKMVEPVAASVNESSSSSPSPAVTSNASSNS